MKWTYSIAQKLKIASILGVIFILLFVKNVSDKNSFIALGDTFSDVYEDRLLAESYIYEFSDHLSRKKLLIDDSKDIEALKLHNSAIKEHHTSIQQLLVAFGKTQLTPTEEVLFRDLKKKIQQGILLEKQYITAMETGVSTEQSKKLLDESFYATLSNLNHLSHIQITEGQRLNQASQKIVFGSASQSQFELSLLMVLGIVILVLIVSSKSAISKIAQNSSLN